MKRFWRIVAGILALALTVYFLVVASTALDLAVLRQAFASITVWFAVLAAAVLYAVIIPITGWAWSVLLSARSESWSPSVLSMALGLSQLAKYIPGNIAQHAARAAIAMRQGMAATSLFATVAQETVLAVAASVIVGLLALLASGRGWASLGPDHASLLMISSAVLCIAVLLLSTFRGVSRYRPAGRVARLLAALVTLPGWRATGKVLSAYAFNYLLIGAGLWSVAIVLGESASLTYPVVTSAFALSWLLGFMTPGSPAGLGAREGIMLMLLQGTSSPEKVVLFVVLARVVTMVGDIISFLGAALLQFRTGHAGPADD
jgi:glycosyltransferase 2 family protein